MKNNNKIPGKLQSSACHAIDHVQVWVVQEKKNAINDKFLLMKLQKENHKECTRKL